MAQLSSYDSPDTPETDDSVEVKVLSSCPSPGTWACEFFEETLWRGDGAYTIWVVIQLLEKNRQVQQG